MVAIAPDPLLADQPPCDPNAERHVLASAMADGSCLDTLSLKAPDFYDHAHADAWRSLLDLRERGRPINAVSLHTDLTRRGIDPDRKLIGELEELSLLGAHDASYHADIVHTCASKRRLIVAGARIQELGFDRHAKGRDAYDQAQSYLDEATARRTRRATSVQLPEVAELAWRANKAASVNRESARAGRIYTGMDELDDYLRGFRRGQMSIIAARPGVGKTSLAMALLLRMARRGHKVLLVSLESNEEEYGANLLAHASQVHNSDIEDGYGDEGRISEASRELFELQNTHWMAFPDTVSVPRLGNIVRHHVARHEIELVCIDYAQRIEQRGEIYDAMTAICKGIVKLARSLKVHCLALAQLKRPAQGRRKEPTFDELKGSGQWEQDAHSILLLERPQQGKPLNDNHAKLHVSKNRNGQCGVIDLSWHGPTVTFNCSHAPKPPCCECPWPQEAR